MKWVGGKDMSGSVDWRPSRGFPTKVSRTMANLRDGSVASSPTRTTALSPAARSTGLEPAPSKVSAALRPVAFEDEIRLENSQITVGVSPQVGRIVRFHRRGEPNLIWLTTPAAARKKIRGYVNWGGDKVWPAMQFIWGRLRPGHPGGWPPDGVIDGQPWQILEQAAHRLVMESREQPDLRLVCRRTIELSPEAARLTIRNRLVRTQPSPLPAVIWSVTQVRHAQMTLLDVAADRPELPDWTWINLTGRRPTGLEIAHPLAPDPQDTPDSRAVVYEPPKDPAT